MLSNNVGKNNKALKLQEHFGQIEDIYLMFAKKTSVFHSLFVGHALCSHISGEQSVDKPKNKVVRRQFHIMEVALQLGAGSKLKLQLDGCSPPVKVWSDCSLLF